MRTLRIKLRLIRTMQTNNLVSYQIPSCPQRRGYPFLPQTRTPIPPTEVLLEPRPLLNRPLEQPPLAYLKPVRRCAVERRTIVRVVGAVRHPRDHRADGVHPVCVDGGDGRTGCYGDGGACGRAWRVAGEGGVRGFEDGVVGGPGALGEPGGGGLHGDVAVGVVAGGC